MHEKSSNLNIQENLNFGKVTSNLNFVVYIIYNRSFFLFTIPRVGGGFRYHLTVYSMVLILPVHSIA